MALPQGREEYYLGLFQQAEANQDLQTLNNLRSQYLAESGAMTPTPTAPMTGQQAFQQSTQQYATPPPPQTGWLENMGVGLSEGFRQFGEDVDLQATRAADWLGLDDWANEQRRLRKGYDEATQEYGGYVDPRYDPKRVAIDLPGDFLDVDTSTIAQGH